MTAQTNTLPAPSRFRIKRVLEALTGAVLAATHSSFALLGWSLAIAIAALVAKPDWRVSVEQQVLGWLMQRQTDDVLTSTADPVAVERATATPLNELPKNQANVALWLSRKYRVAPEPLSALVAEAFAVGQRVRIEPTLILAVMAIESRFNPFAQSSVGAQGLMQVMTRVHTDKYEGFGGNLAAFDPLANLRVGAQVLKDCVKRTGTVEGGLSCYVGAIEQENGTEYVAKVLSEHQRLQNVAQGLRVPVAEKKATPPVNTPEASKELAEVPAGVWLASVGRTIDDNSY